jgi:flagellar basal-body rod protein FlgB
MSVENTIDAVRLALNLHETRARTASMNVSNAGKSEATAMRVDFAKVEAALREVANAGSESEAASWLAAAASELRATKPQSTLDPIRLDEQVGDIATAGVEYQALTEALSRQFGLMRIAVTGRA